MSTSSTSKTPEPPACERLSIAHRAAIDALRARYGHETSSHAFQTLYIWRQITGDRLYLTPDCYSLNYTAKGANAWLFPCGAPEAARTFIAAHLPEEGFRLCYLRPQDAAWLEQTFPGCFRLDPSPGDNEYLISREGHLSLTGTAYKNHRWRVNLATRKHSLRTLPLSAENLADAAQVLHVWHAAHAAQGALNIRGDEADLAALREMDTLGIIGVLLLADGEPFGVAAAYLLNGQTADAFIGKDVRRDPALGYYLLRELFRALPETVREINLEDDLNLPGLRAMKRNMVPVRMNRMWTAVRR